jgi:hypothetical protein
MSSAKLMAVDVIAGLKSGVVLKGTVRSHSRDGSLDLAWIAVQFPMIGERQVLIKDEPNLEVGQQVVIECVPNPQHPKRHMFRMARLMRGQPGSPAL